MRAYSCRYNILRQIITYVSVVGKVRIKLIRRRKIQKNYGGSMINKLVLTKGAIFDYEEIVCNEEMDRRAFRASAEKLIGGDKEELRVDYKDGKTGKELILFIRRGYDFGLMRVWILEGICEKCDYSEDMEKSGVIKEWLSIEIE